MSGYIYICIKEFFLCFTIKDLTEMKTINQLLFLWNELKHK